MNTRRRRLTAIPAALAALALALSACGGSATGNEGAVSDDGEVDLSQVTLIVGDQKGTSAQAILEAAGLDDTPYKIEWKQFTSGPPMLEALNTNAIHVGQVGNTPPIFAAAAGGEFKVVQAMTYSGLGDAIVVPKDSDITDVSQLKGKSVAVAQGSSANYNLLAQLEEAGLKYSDISVENLQPADALAAFSAGHVDAWAIWEPFTSQAEVSEGAKVIATGNDVVNGYGFQVASDAAIEDPATKAALSDYLERITSAQLWASENPEAWAKVWSEGTGLDESITLAASKKRPVTVFPVDDTVVSSEQEMADSFAANGLIPEEVDLTDYFTDEFDDVTLAAKAPAASS
ncbi:ABC transporter substrate-binding protein [Nocardioides flavescens]|uniref:Putative aliphatic sulfonates-binding protein n=1 Tax=Nocardioides flavescens TaxID=2691959 RepID=A0A6L7EYN7_9ACTN|nr:ABC transporter substrate-binding protein [Nocardioides flavescens]MXG90748.1 aliphatic sulfonate ABC transporter substrate-binding protein [Nocardioides flavescens]